MKFAVLETNQSAPPRLTTRRGGHAARKVKRGGGENSLDDEPGSLLDSLNAWQEKVVVGSSREFLSFLAP